MMWHPQRPTYPRTVVERAIDTFRSTIHMQPRGFGNPEPRYLYGAIVNLVGIRPVTIRPWHETRCMAMNWMGGVFEGTYASQIMAPHPWQILVEEDDWL